MKNFKRKSTILAMATVCTISVISALGFQQQYADSIETPKVESHTKIKSTNQPSLNHKKAAQEKAAQEQAAKEQAAQEPVAQEQAAQEPVAQEPVAQEQAAQEQAGVQTYNITSQYMDLSQDQAFINQNPHLFAENTINGTEYFAAHYYGGGSFISGLKIGDIIVVNGSTKYRVDTIQIVGWNSDEAWSILESGVDAVIQTCTDSTGAYDYFDTLSRVY